VQKLSFRYISAQNLRTKLVCIRSDISLIKFDYEELVLYENV